MRVTLKDIFWYFLKLGTIGFGGPVALVGYMERDLVEKNTWVTKDEFSQGVAIAATLPGPLAAQVAMWIGYLRRGIAGCAVSALALIAPPFLIVLVIAVMYTHFENEKWVRALFYGIGPTVAVLIAESCYRLARKYVPDWKMAILSLTCLVITVSARAELAILFILGGIIGIFVYVLAGKGQGKNVFLPTFLLCLGMFSFNFTRETLWQLGYFFFKAGAFTFGSGLAVAPFLHQGAVLDHHWLTERQFLDSVAVGMITPGPVVIMATFAGYLIQGFLGSCVASLCVFLPIFLMVLLLAPYVYKHRENPYLTSFVTGATSAAVGSITGAGIIIGRGVITDLPTILIAIAVLILIVFIKIPGYLLVAATGITGLILFR
jgi:chromate transporter